ncbi:glycosyltransferase family 4 protein [Calidifontibacter indicus]|uniref:glycosyltransferase family 4 protein n=1 Tax=Calidifontibacter indicus TaxID=419650 RepID=UPI003D737C1A
MSPKRILVVGHTAQLGGNELFMTRLVPALADDDLEMVVLLFEDGPFADLLRERGVEVHVRPLPSDVVSAGRYAAGKVTTLGRLGPGVIRHAVGLAPWLAEQRIDAVWANTFKAMATVSPAVKVRRLPLLWFLHDRVTPDYLPRRLVGPMRAAFRQVPDAVVANSRSTAATVGGRPVTVVYPGLSADAERLRVEPVLPPVVGMLGRVSPTKGQLELVRALPDVLAAHPEVQVRIVGSPMFGAEDYLDEVRSEAERLGVATAIDWVGFTDDPRPELDRMTVCVHAATVAEPFGQVLTEAMARSVPIIATRGGGASEVVTPVGAEPRGELIERGDVPGLRNALLRVLGDVPAAQRRADAVQPAVVAEYSLDNSVRTMREVLRALISGGRHDRQR